MMTYLFLRESAPTAFHATTTASFVDDNITHCLNYSLEPNDKPSAEGPPVRVVGLVVLLLFAPPWPWRYVGQRLLIYFESPSTIGNCRVYLINHPPPLFSGQALRWMPVMPPTNLRYCLLI